MTSDLYRAVDGTLYRVLAHALDAETHTALVLYQRVDASGPIWSHTHDDFYAQHVLASTPEHP